MQILQLDVSGAPQSWLSVQEAATHYASDRVSWTVGDVVTTLRGGHNAISGQISSLDIHPIIALNGMSSINLFDVVPSLTNRKLFKRDRNMCGMCGIVLPDSELTRDHIFPRARGGRDHWLNVVTCCKLCNTSKGCRTPEEAGMPLLFAPYVPSVFEDFILAGRNIRGDVHEWLASKVGKNSRWAPEFEWPLAA